MNKTIFSLLFATILLIITAGGTYGQSLDLPTASPISFNIPPADIDSALSEAKKVSGINSLVIVKEGTIIGEYYRPNISPDSAYHVRSVTKSIMGLLYAIAFEQHVFTNRNQRLNKLWPAEVATLQGRQPNITLDHLLTMRGGFDWHEGSEYGPWITSQNPSAYLIDKPLAHRPGRRFGYSSASTHLLSVILAHQTNKSVLEFAQEHLFDPLGINSARWATDALGYEDGGSGLLINTHDLAKIGIMITQKGFFDGRQVVSESAINQMMQVKKRLNQRRGNFKRIQYADLWWIDNSLGTKVQFARGYGGQYLFCVPEFQLVVAASSQWLKVGGGIGRQERTLERIFTEIILPAVINSPKEN